MAEAEVTVVSEEKAAVGNPYLAAALAWLVPGSGHFYLGRRRRAAGFFVIVLFSLLLGFFLHGKLHRVISDQPLTTLATLSCMGVGAPYFAARFVVDYEGDMKKPGYEYGSAFILTAGLMNVLLILDAWDIGRGRKD